MTTDSDISAALPEPPPPRRARRDAAIEAALRRFDGGGAPDRQHSATPASWRGRIVRPQFAAVATVAMVALIGLPIWMSGDHQFSSVSREAPASAVPTAVPSPPPSGPIAGRGPTAAPPMLPTTPPPMVSAKLELAPVSPSAALANNGYVRCAGGNCDAPVDALHLDARATANRARFSAPEPQAAQESRTDKDFSRARQNRAETADAAPPPPPPQAVASPPRMAYAAPPRSPAVVGLVVDEGASRGADIAVTGTRVSRSSSEEVVAETGWRQSAAKPAGRGDWNACTVDDPHHRLSACKKLVDPAAPGSDGRAAAHVADGLSLAWQNDLDGAIAAFDQAIAISPRLSFAYLNRGLAHVHKGELERAGTDLDQAIRYAPTAARNYYSRALVWRQRGDSRRAKADEDRAIALDHRYAVLILR